MMNFKLTRSDAYLILIYYLVVIVISLIDYASYDDPMVLFWEILFVVGSNTLSVYVFFLIFNRFLPERRLAELFIYGILSLTAINSLSNFILGLILDWEFDQAAYLFIYYSFLEIVEDIGIICALLAGKKMYEAQLKFLKSEKEKRESELRFLKAQIDPHFLFNNLNTLDALIDTDPQMAKVYLNKLALLYRYLIASKDQEVVLLEEELEFTQNYIYLIHCRFGTAFKFEVENELEEDYPMLIPPGALQTLLENVVKHNQASAEKPVKCRIHINEERIVVNNTLQPKKHGVFSTGIGLTTLRARYELLSNSEIKITDTNQQFVITLPAIKQVN